MDYYPQPRPVLYGTSGEETPPQTQTAPVRTGPPRYPPAPPLAGDAPDPFDRPSGTFASLFWGDHRWGTKLLALFYALASIYSLYPILTGQTGFSNVLVGQILLSAELGIGLIVVACLMWLGGREYLLALALTTLHICLGIAVSQWQLPGLWAAIAVMLYLLRPSLRRGYWRKALWEIRCDIARYKCRHPRRRALLLKRIPRVHHGDWRIRW